MAATRLKIFISSVQNEFKEIRRDLKAFLLGDAVLLFGANPQRFHRTAETKCIHCHGTQYRRPFASLQVYGGDLFDQADQARDFVLAKINRTIGTRAAGITAPATYELPPDAVGEAIVNAIAHCDYHSNASVEVRLYADRLEVWNPGMLPGTLTLDSLRNDHPSIPYNPLLAESLYLARYIERVGSGTQAIIALCREADLPEPEFEQREGSFFITLWRDWLMTEVMDHLKLNDRQILCLKTLKAERQTTTMAYQNFLGCSRRTAARDLDDLLRKGFIQRQGAGRSAYYVLVRNRAINLPIVPPAALEISSDSDAGNRVINVPNVPSPETSGSEPPKAKSKKDDKSATKEQSGNKF